VQSPPSAFEGAGRAVSPAYQASPRVLRYALWTKCICVEAIRLCYLLSMMRLDIAIYVAIIVNVCFSDVPYAKEDD